MGYIDLIPDVFRLTMVSLATAKSYHTQKFNVGNKCCIGVTIKASQALSVAVAYGIVGDTAAAAGVDVSGTLPYKTSATSFASSTGTEGGTYHELAIPPHARQAQLVISNASGSTVSGAVIDAALRVVAYPAASGGGGSGDFGDITGWPGTSSQFIKGDGSVASLGATDILPAIFFGRGEDGDATIAAGTTTLTAPKSYGTLTLQTGAILDTRQNLISAQTIIKQGTGKIVAGGKPGGNASGAIAGIAGASVMAAGLGSNTAGVAGRTGVTGAGTAGLSGISPAGGAGAGGYAGGDYGGGGGAGSGGAGGLPSQSPGVIAPGSVARFASFSPYWLRGATLVLGGATGPSGGSGGGDGTTAGRGGGGSGASGRPMLILARAVVIESGASGPLLVADGGAGGNGGGSASGNVGGGGGGAGAGGGAIRAVFGSITANGFTGALIQANGGAGGNGSDGAGTGLGGEGGQGGNGGWCAMYLATSDTWTISSDGNTVSLATAPTTPATSTGSSGTAGRTVQISI